VRILVIEDEEKSSRRERCGKASKSRAYEVAAPLPTAEEGVVARQPAIRSEPGCCSTPCLARGATASRGPTAHAQRKAVRRPFILTAKTQSRTACSASIEASDDSIVSRFTFSELLARIRALLRRGRHGPGPENCPVTRTSRWTSHAQGARREQSLN